MVPGNKILLSVTLETDEDYENFRFLTEPAIAGLSVNLRKKLLFCLTELIQNNIIHNHGSKSEILVYATDKQIIIESKQKVNKENLYKVKKLIELINSLELQALEELKKSNIKSSIAKNKTSPGNGLLTCRIKSGNIIDLHIIDDVSNSEKVEISIFVKTDIYGKNNQSRCENS